MNFFAQIVSFFNSEKRSQNALARVLYARGKTGGLHKRIDENREILERLISDCPEFLLKNPWVISQFKAADEFFEELDELGGFRGTQHNRPLRIRPWPLREFQVEDVPEFSLKTNTDGHAIIWGKTSQGMTTMASDVLRGQAHENL